MASRRIGRWQNEKEEKHVTKRKLFAMMLMASMTMTTVLGGALVQAEESDAKWDTSKEDTITVSVINNFYTAGEKKLAEEYMKMHPETKVVIDVVSDNDTYKTKMMTSMEGDRSNAPDIVHGNFIGMALTNNSMDLAVDKGYLYDMTEMLDEENPYNGGLVRDAFTEVDVTLVRSESGGKYTPWLPFDKIGFAVFYNADILESEGIEPPTTYDELASACEKLKAAGYDVPLSAGMESFRLANTLADAYYRNNEGEALVQPGDAIWDETTMSANDGFTFDESNMLCDQFTVFSNERQLKYASENGVNTEANQKIFEQFYRVAQYFPENWIGGDSTQAITDFESQTCPMLYQASYNAAMIMNDINSLPEDMAFNWGTSQIATFGETPEGFGNDLRGYWDFGNIMSIIATDDQDHLERVKDFYKYWYSKDGAALCFEETLNNANYVQGPCVIEGVTLSEDLEALLDGFRSAPSKEWACYTGLQWNTTADAPLFYDLMNQFTSGKITAEEYLEQENEVYQNYNNESIDRAGFDLDPTTEDQAK